MSTPPFVDVILNGKRLSSSMDPRLFGAVRSGDVALLQQLCAEDANLLKSSTPHGNTALHLAVIFRQDEFAKDLCLMCPSLLSAANGDGNTPLLLAAALGIQPIVDFVIDKLESPAYSIGDVEEGYRIPNELMRLPTDKYEGPSGKRGLTSGVRLEHPEDTGKLAEDLELPWEKNSESPPLVKSSMARDVDNLMRLPTDKYEGPSGKRGLPAAERSGHPEDTGKLAEDLELPWEKNNSESPPLVKSSMARDVDSLMRLPTDKYEGPSGKRALPAAERSGHPDDTEDTGKLAEDLDRMARDMDSLMRLPTDEYLKPSGDYCMARDVDILMRLPTGKYDPSDNTEDTESVEEGNHKLRVTNRMRNNALHEALRNGHGEVALVLLRAEPELARQVNNNGESPLYMACYRSLEVVVEKLLRLPRASDKGPNGETALHAAVMVGHSELVKALLKERPGIRRAAANNGGTPLHYASRFNKLAVVKLLLESDASLAYAVDKDGYQPITLAVIRGYVRIVEEIVRRFPDSALMASSNGNTPLHIAVDNGSVEVVKYILRTPELQVLINQPNYDGEVPLHIAVRECNKETLRALLACKSLDKEAVNNQGQTAVDVFFSHPEFTLRRVSTRKMLISAFPNHHRLARRQPTLEKKIQKGDGTMESLFRSYANNSIVVATLMATITFAAAFTVPGGYDGNQDADQGLPILARKAAFKAFLISDTIALCASLAVAFPCIFAPWVDDDFLVRNVDKTRRLLFCGFAAMSVAFATGLYAVVAPGSLWLAAVICVLCCSLPLITYLAGEWTVYGGRLKLLMSSNLRKSF